MGMRKGQTNSGSFKKGEHKSKSTEIKKGDRLSINTEFGNKPPWNKGLSGKDYKKHYKKGFGGLIKIGSKPWNKGNYNISRGLKRILRDCFKMQSWRNSCFRRDNFTCQECGIYGTKLVVHHIVHFESIIRHYNVQSVLDGLFLNELWDINNGVTLCKECHKIKHSKGYRG